MPTTARKILIIGPSWVGDMVMAQSLFMALKAQSDCVIDVLALAWTAPLLDRMPEVNRAIAMPISHGVLDIKTRYVIGKQLKVQQYDQAIVLPNSWKSALIPWFAGIPVRTGWKGEARYGLLNDIRTLDKQALPLMVQRFVALAHPAKEAKVVPDCPVPLMQANAATYPVPALAPGQQRLILCPGAEFGPAKQWPTSAYATVANAMSEHGWQVIILGSKADQATGDEIQKLSANQTVNLCGLTQLDEAIDLLATADAVVSNDSGLMHITAALQIPLVAIYGPTSPDFTPPLSDNARLLQIDIDCGPCFQRSCPEQHHRCMIGISPDSVINALGNITLH